MPVPISAALTEQSQTLTIKIESLRSPGRYLVSSMLAGAYIGVAVVLLLAVTGPLSAAPHPTRN